MTYSQYALLLIGLLVLVLIIFSKDPRMVAMKKWSEAKGWTFAAAKQKNFDDRFPEFRCLKQGNFRFANYLVQGQWGGYSFMAFDLHYGTTPWKDNKWHMFSAVILDPGILLIPLLVRRETWADRLVNLAGFNDIDFDSADFSRQYHVSSPDRKWAYDVLHVRAIESLLQGPGHPFQFSDRRAIVWADQAMNVRQFEDALKMMTQLLDTLPRFAKQAAQERATAEAMAP